MSAVHSHPATTAPLSITWPTNIEAEQAVLGAILADNRHLEAVSDLLSADDFADLAHALIYGALLEQIERGRAVTPVSLRLIAEGEEPIRKAGGVHYLAQLAGSASVMVVDVAGYAEVIVDASRRRRLIQANLNTIGAAQAPGRTAVEVQGDLEAALTAIHDGRSITRECASIGSASLEEVRRAEEAYKNGAPNGLPTGLIDLDRILGGLFPADLVILAGRPGMGKSALLGSISRNIARRHLGGREQPAPVGVFTLEMSSGQWAMREHAEATGIDTVRQRRGDVSPEQMAQLIEASNALNEIPIWIDDRASLTIDQLRRAAARMKRQHDIRMIGVDYLQLMDGAADAENRTQEVSKITRGLKAMAKELDIPVLALSQLSRAVEQREDKRPMLSDLRESGSIEQDADAVIFMYRHEYYLGRAEPVQRSGEDGDKFSRRHSEWLLALDNCRGTAEAIVAKQRFGSTGTAHLRFDAIRTTFENLMRGA